MQPEDDDLEMARVFMDDAPAPSALPDDQDLRPTNGAPPRVQPVAVQAEAASGAVEPSPKPLSITQSVQEIEQPGAGGWTIPLLCAGIALVACCILIPEIDENRRVAYECEKLKLDLTQIKQQAENNAEFVKRVSEDRVLAERLAQRQMKFVRQGTAILELPGEPKDMSPLGLVAVPPPPMLVAYQPTGGRIAEMCRHPRTKLYLLGAGLMLMAGGLVLGYQSRAD